MSNSLSYCPDEGHIIYIDFDPQVGREQAGRRPAIVLSPESYNRKTGLAVVCPVTRQSKAYPFEVSLPAGLKVTGVVLADHIKNLSWTGRNASHICDAPIEVLEDVRAMVAALIHL
jgi:mRNA interferase MazF